MTIKIFDLGLAIFTTSYSNDCPSGKNSRINCMPSLERRCPKLGRFDDGLTSDGFLDDFGPSVVCPSVVPPVSCSVPLDRSRPLVPRYASQGICVD